MKKIFLQTIKDILEEAKEGLFMPIKKPFKPKKSTLGSPVYEKIPVKYYCGVTGNKQLEYRLKK